MPFINGKELDEGKKRILENVALESVKEFDGDKAIMLHKLYTHEKEEELIERLKEKDFSNVSIEELFKYYLSPEGLVELFRDLPCGVLKLSLEELLLNYIKFLFKKQVISYAESSKVWQDVCFLKQGQKFSNDEQLLNFSYYDPPAFKYDKETIKELAQKAYCNLLIDKLKKEGDIESDKIFLRYLKHLKSVCDEEAEKTENKKEEPTKKTRRRI